MMTCFRTPDGRTLYSVLTKQQYTRFFYELNTNEQPFAVAYRIAVTAKPRVRRTKAELSSLFSPDNIKKLKELKSKRHCSTKNAVKALASTNKLRVLGETK